MYGGLSYKKPEENLYDEGVEVIKGTFPGSGNFQPPKKPFVDYNALKKNIISLVFYYLIKKSTEKYREMLRERKERGFVPRSIVRDLIDITIENFSQHFDMLLYETFPKFRVWEEYRKGATRIDRLYTVEFKGYEIPIHVCDPDDPEPHEEVIKNAVKTVRYTYKSPLNDSADFFRGNFDLAADKITRGDYGRLIDQYNFRKWFSRMEMYMIQQNDPKEKEYTVTVNGEVFTIRMYRKKKEESLWKSLTSLKGRVFRYIVEDKIYDGIDWWFDLYIQPKILEWEKTGFIPEGYSQELVKREYKVISKLVRDIYRNPSRLPLEFDLTPILEPGPGQRI